MPPIDGPPASATALETGAVVGGRFEIRGQLGAGGMGLVYRAHDRALDQPVALKVLRADLERDPRLRDSFRHEVKLARQVTHPAVCRLHDLEEADGRHFLTMELIEGETLAQRLAREPRPSVSELTRIGRGIAAGLAAAHAGGVLHLDLKPGNVMLERSGRVVVMDFGFARALAPSSTTGVRGAVSGTVAYMAPEQLRGGELDQRVDVYALGLVLFEMACGRVPGHEATAAATAAARERAGTPDPRAERHEVPERLRRVIRRCLEPAPGDRYASVADVLRDLGAGGWTADVTGRVRRASSPRWRRRLVVAVMIVVGVAVAAAAALSSWPRGPRVLQVPRLAVVVDDRQPAPDAAATRLRRAAQRRVALELAELGLAAATEVGAAPVRATARVRAARTPEGFTVDVEIGEGRTRATRRGRGDTLRAAAASAAAAVVEVVRTPPAALDPHTLAALGTSSPEAAREVQLARAAVRRQDRERARRHAARALALDPGLVAPHLALAGVEESFTDASRAHLRRARDAARGRDDLPARLARAWARYEVDADDVGGTAAVAALYAAHPDDAEVAFRYADCLGDVWQVEKANAIFERLLETSPGHVPAMLRLFDLRISHGEVEQLQRDGARLVERAPEEPQAYVVHGRALLAAGRLDEALRVFGEALVVDPDHAAALTYRARTLLYQHDTAGARAVARRLLVGGPPRRASGLRVLGVSFLLEGRFAEGLRHLEESLVACPDEPSDSMYTHRVIVYVLQDLGDFEAAHAAARRWEEAALKASFWSQVQYARQEQDAANLRLGRLTPAAFRALLPGYLADLRRRAGDDVLAGQGPALSMRHALALGQHREALLSALKVEVPAMYTVSLVADCYAHLGEPEKAVEWYRRLLARPDEELIPTLLVRARLRLGETLDALGRREEAAAAYSSFVDAWGNADRSLPDVERARRRLTALAGGATPSPTAP